MHRNSSCRPSLQYLSFARILARLCLLTLFIVSFSLDGKVWSVAAVDRESRSKLEVTNGADSAVNRDLTPKSTPPMKSVKSTAAAAESGTTTAANTSTIPEDNADGGNVGAATVSSIAESMSATVSEIAGAVLRHEELQQLYDSDVAACAGSWMMTSPSTPEPEPLNVTEVASTAARKIAQQVAKVTQTVKQLVVDIAKLHDSHQMESTTVHGTRYSTSNLVSENTIKYIERGGKQVVMSSNDRNVDATFKSGLDRLLSRSFNQSGDSSLLYFGAADGLLRYHPTSLSWDDQTPEFDHRGRPWYTAVSATSMPVNVVVVIDSSYSRTAPLNGDYARRFLAAISLLRLLSNVDRVNVVVTSSDPDARHGQTADQRHSRLTLYNWSRDGNRNGSRCRPSSLLAASSYTRIQLIEALTIKMQRSPRRVVESNGSVQDLSDAFKTAVDLLKHSGTSHCRNVVIFVTSTSSLLKRGQDSACSNLLVSDLTSMKSKFPVQVSISTVVVRSSNDDVIPNGLVTSWLRTLRHLSCLSGGQTVHLSSDVDAADFIYRLSPLLDRTDSKSGLASQSRRSIREDQVVWTLPYVSPVNRRPVLTASMAVYSNITGRFIGAVGVDIATSNLLLQLTSSLPRNAYGFMLRSRDAATVAHPLLEQLLTSDEMIPVTALEMDGGQPQQFDRVVQMANLGHSGLVKVIRDAIHGTSYNEAVYWRPNAPTNYLVTQIPDSEWTLVLRVPASLTSDASNGNHPSCSENQLTGLNYLHSFTGYRQEMSHIISSLNLTSSDPSYPGSTISNRHSVIALTDRSYCDVNNGRNLSTSELHQLINSETEGSTCPKTSIRNDARLDVKLTSFIEQYWLTRPEQLQKVVRWTYIASSTGAVRIHPGIELDINRFTSNDPTRLAWFASADVNRGVTAISGPHRDLVNFPQESVKARDSSRLAITISRAIHRSNSAGPPECHTPLGWTLQTLQGPGCPCYHNNQCRSGRCYRRSCSDDTVHSVSAADLVFDEFRRKLFDAAASSVESGIADRSRENRATSGQQAPHSGLGGYCGTKYRCAIARTKVGSSPMCSTSCYLVDDRAIVVLSSSDRSNSDTVDVVVSNVDRHLHNVDNDVMSLLLRRGVYIRKRYSNGFGAVVRAARLCDSTKLRREKLHQIGCSYVDGMFFYVANASRLEDFESRMLVESLDNRCREGSKVYVTAIESTNLLLVVVDQNPLVYTDASTSTTGCSSNVDESDTTVNDLDTVYSLNEALKAADDGDDDRCVRPFEASTSGHTPQCGRDDSDVTSTVSCVDYNRATASFLLETHVKMILNCFIFSKLWIGATDLLF